MTADLLSTILSKENMSKTEELLSKLEEERDALKRELIGTQEMLAFVLQEVGEPVVVAKSRVSEGLPANAQIAVDDNAKMDAFVFSLVEVDE